jgi:hypothetical protein
VIASLFRPYIKGIARRGGIEVLVPANIDARVERSHATSPSLIILARPVVRSSQAMTVFSREVAQCLCA